VPYVAAGDRSFHGSTTVALDCIADDAEIYYSVGAAEPTTGSMPYREPFTLAASTSLSAFALSESGGASQVMTAEFIRRPRRLTIALKHPYSPMYTAGGDEALVDFIRGTDDFRTGAWQGYQGVDIDAVVDLGRVEEITRVTAGFLRDQNSWIFMPERIEFSVSEDGERFTIIARWINGQPGPAEDALTMDFTTGTISRETRYVKVVATNIGICPDWHKGAGHKAWLFADEIVIE
jgi:hypothetical protein